MIFDLKDFVNDLSKELRYSLASPDPCFVLKPKPWFSGAQAFRFSTNQNAQALLHCDWLNLQKAGAPQGRHGWQDPQGLSRPCLDFAE